MGTYKPIEKAECLRLRLEENRSYREIALITGISRGTLSIWLAGIPLVNGVATPVLDHPVKKKMPNPSQAPEHAYEACALCAIPLSSKKPRKFCSVACSNRSRIKHRRLPDGTPFSNCPTCGKALAGSCSQQCRRCFLSTRTLIPLEQITSWAKVRARVFLLRGRKCEECGFAKPNPFTGIIPVQVNHKNGDPQDHRLENLEVLCPTCHSMTEHFMFYGRSHKGTYGKKGTKRYRV